MNQETKEIFSIRKFKTGTHSALLAKFGIVLASTVALGMGTGMVHADEATATPSQPTTAQVAPSAESTPTTANSLTAPSVAPVKAPTTTVVEPAGKDLTTAVDDAKNTGVIVTQDPIVKVDSKETALKNNEAEAKKVEEAKKKQEAQAKAYAEALAKNQKEFEEAQKRPDVIADKDGVVVYGKVDDKATGLDYYKNINVVDNVGKTNTVAVEGTIGWTKDSQIKDVSGMTKVPSKSNGVDTASDYTFTNFKKGSSFTVSKMGKTKDGRNINIKVTLTDDVKPISSTGVVTPTIVYYASKGAFGTTFYNGQKLSADYQMVDDNGNPLNILQAFAIGDMDWLQGSKISFSGSTILKMNPDGSFLKEDKGYLWDTTGKGVSGFENAPKGTYLVVGYGDTISYSHHTGLATESYDKAEQESWDKDYKKEGAGTAFSLFGSTGAINILPQPVKQLPVTVSYHLSSYDLNMEVVKDVKVNGKSVNNGTIKKGGSFTYDLTGVLVSKDRLEKAINQYDFSDDFDENHDKYVGVFKLTADVMIKLKDGTLIKVGDDLTKYANQNWNTRNGSVIISLSKDFLNNIADDSDFKASVTLDMTRIKAGHVENTYTNTYNGQQVVSNTVLTQTPEDPTPPVKPTSQTPVTPTPKTPVAQQSIVSLPHAGDEAKGSVIMTALGAIMVSFVGFTSIKKKKEEN